MKIIHMADVHLDSSLSRHYSREGAKSRRAELMSTFISVLRYGREQGVRAVLIAGDLFDTPAVSPECIYQVLENIRAFKGMDFFYLRGNHDTANVLKTYEGELPENLYFFKSSWSGYRLSKKLALYGRELSYTRGDGRLSAGLRLQENDLNIVMLHGGLIQSGAAALQEGEIAADDFRHINIDYLALGHIHRAQTGALDGRGIWSYPGCLEGRGFDECGEHGFIMLDIDEDKHSIKTERMDFSKRHFHEIEADVSGLISNGDILEMLTGMLPEEQDGAKYILRGGLPACSSISIDFLKQQLSGRLELLEIVDETELELDYEALLHEQSLKGELLRLIKESGDMTEEDKKRVAELGIRLLQGEKI